MTVLIWINMYLAIGFISAIAQYFFLWYMIEKRHKQQNAEKVQNNLSTLEKELMKLHERTGMYFGIVFLGFIFVFWLPVLIWLFYVKVIKK